MTFINRFNILLSLFVLLFVCQSVFAQGVRKQIFGINIRADILDMADEGEGSWGYGNDVFAWDGFQFGIFASKATFFGCRNFTDTLGTTHDVFLAGNGQFSVDDQRIMVPIPDENGFTIHRFVKYQPPTITVDGSRLDDPFPFNGADMVAPAKVPGGAYMMIQSTFNTHMGVTVKQKVLAFTQKNHDDYFIYDWTFINTGNVDLDEEIELSQTIDDFYFLRFVRHREERRGWSSSYGQMPGDSLRLVYGYPKRAASDEFDTFGSPNDATGFLEHPHYNGEAVLFASATVNDMVNDDPNQPAMTGTQDADFPPITVHPNELGDEDKRTLYLLMEEGFLPIDGTPEMVGARPGDHSVRFDQRGLKFPEDAPWYGWVQSDFYACGPWDLAPGDSIRVVFATVSGIISEQKAFEVGKAWKEGTLSWGDNQPRGTTEILPPQYQAFPSLYASDSKASEVVNWAKDNWVHTGKDSLFQTTTAAQWAVRNNYNVPEPPPAPSIEVQSLPDGVKISWGNESEVAPDFAGYRVYRARDSWYTHVPEGSTELVGVWQMIFETTGNSVHEFIDRTAQRGFAYFYYVVAFDNGTDNTPDFHGRKESLESPKFLNMTQVGASLTRPPGKALEDIRVVPNPWHINAGTVQFGNALETKHKILFVNLPPICTIKIYSESGDLVKTIEHTDGSGDEAWGGNFFEEQQVSRSNQIVVSGLYIAYIETPDGESIFKKFVIVR